MDITCARCGLKQEDIEPQFVTPPPTDDNPEPEGEWLKRFQLYDNVRDVHICEDCAPVYNELMPKALEYPMLDKFPEARAELLSGIDKMEFGFFKKLLPGRQY